MPDTAIDQRSAKKYSSARFGMKDPVSIFVSPVPRRTEGTTVHHGNRAGGRAGYRSVSEGKKYRYDKMDDKNYLETRFSSTGFMIGLNVSLVYRFQIR